MILQDIGNRYSPKIYRYKINYLDPIEYQDSEKSYTVLIVDDEPINLFALNLMLRKTFQNIIVIQATDGAEGFKKFV